MLEIMRKKAGSWVMKFVLFGIVVVFAFWGVGTYSGNNLRTVLTVDKVKVPYSEYRDLYNTLVESYRQSSGGSLDPETLEELDLKEKTVETLIERYLILEAARSLEFYSTEEEIASRISANPSFQQGGLFSSDRYRSFLDYNRLTPEGYEASIAKDVTLEKMTYLLRLAAVVTPQEVDENLSLLTKRMTVEALPLDPSAFVGRVPAASTDELEDYFDQHEEDYRVPEQFVLAVVEVDPSRFRDRIEVDDEEIEDFYENNENEFTEEAAYNLKRLLFKFTKDADTESISRMRAAAEDAVDRIRSGKMTISAAMKQWQDPEAARGYLKERELSTGIVDAADSLEKGGVSDPVPTSRGFEVVYLVDSRPERLRPLEEVKKNIADRIIAEKTYDFAYDLADDLLAQVESSDLSMEEASKAQGLMAVRTPPFSRQTLPDSPKLPEDFFKAAFTTEEGEVGDVFEAGDELYLFQTVERNESRIPRFEDVIEKVRAGLLVAKALEQAGNEGKDFADQVRNGRSLKSVARELGLRVETTPDFTVVDSSLPGFLEGRKIIKEAFTLSGPGSAAFVEGDRIHYIIAFNEIIPAEENMINTQRQAVLEALRLQKAQDLFLSYVDTMKTGYADKIEVNRDII